MEPVCSKCFPGNMLDVTSYEAFIAENGITKGLIVADKGFQPNAAEGHFSKKTDGTYNLEDLKNKQKTFGTIVLECDLDIKPETAYKAYAEYWEIEIVMRYYKSACNFDETRVHDDYSVIGSEFCDFLSTLLTFRLLKSFDKAGLLNEMNYGKIMSLLRRAKKIKLQGQDWQLIRISPASETILQKLSLLPKPEEPEKRKRGRPKKSI